MGLFAYDLGGAVVAKGQVQKGPVLLLWRLVVERDLMLEGRVYREVAETWISFQERKPDMDRRDGKEEENERCLVMAWKADDKCRMVLVEYLSACCGHGVLEDCQRACCGYDVLEGCQRACCGHGVLEGYQRAYCENGAVLI